MTTDLPTPAELSRPAKRPRSKWVRWYYVGVALLLLAAAVFFHLRRRADEEVLTAHRVRSGIERARIEAIPRGRPAVHGPLEAGTAEEAWFAYRRALAAVPEGGRDHVGAREEEGASPEQVEEGKRAFRHHPAVVRALLQIPRRPSTAPADPLFTLDPSGRWTATSDWIVDAQRATRWLRAAYDQVFVEDPEEALRLAVAACALGADLQRQGAFLNHLVGAAIETTGLDMLRHTLAASSVTSLDAQRVSSDLDALDRARRPWTAVFDAEREVHRGLLLFGGEETFGSQEYGSGGPDRHARAAALRRLDEVADRLRDAAAMIDLDPLGAAERARSILEDPSEDPLYRTLATVYPLVIRREAERRTQREVARVALAVVAWNDVSRMGGPRPFRFLERLEDLVPYHLDKIPKDPWDQKPLRWAGGVGYGTVWSIGQDGIDQGVDETWRSDEEDRGGEVGWRVRGG